MNSEKNFFIYKSEDGKSIKVSKVHDYYEALTDKEREETKKNEDPDNLAKTTIITDQELEV